MTLRIAQVPDPPAGSDWQAVVPGQYIYNVTGITGTLTTFASGAFPDCPDVSGNGNDATYSNSGSTFVTGLVPGDSALQRNAGNGDQIVCNFPIVDVSEAFTYTEWVLFDAPGPHDMQLGGYGVGAPTFATGWSLVVPTADPTRFAVIGNDGLGSSTIFETAVGTVPYDSAPHMIAVTFDPAATPQNNFFLDGVLVPWDVTGVPFAFNGPSAGWDFNIGYSPKVTDEIAILNGALDPTAVAALYAAATDINNYENLVMAIGADVYYHLNGVSTPATARQVTLAVEYGITEVMQIPTGFALASGQGPYLYSWQPGLNSNNENPDGSLVTVAIPPLVLPAGYIISSETLDIQPTDQWNGVLVWWDDSVMNALFDPYLFHDVHLIYTPQTGG